MICEKCGKEFFEDWRKDPRGKARFCSKFCANSREHSKETKDKISKGVLKSIKNGKRNLSPPDRSRIKENARKARDVFIAIKTKEILEAEYDTLSFERLKKRILLEQDNECNVCGLREWRGKPLTLELEHKDGNNQNNKRENLECLCPNCHSLTDTWRGRNKKPTRRKKIKDEELVEAFIETGNIRQALLKVGLAAKGANYGRVKRTLTLNGIEY